jgi:beta-lactamase class D
MKKIFGPILCSLALVSCSRNNVKEDKSLEKYFKENNVNGTFALYNNATDKFTVYNLSRYRDSQYLPASTFKIVNSLIGLQYGIITNDSMVIKWDGVQRWVPEWNKDLTMYEAFRVSSLPYYQEVARRIGKDTMQRALDSLGYAAGKNDTTYVIRTTIDSFWIDNSMKVTPDDQLGLVRKLYFKELPFFPYHQETVKRAMLFEDNANYQLSYKTGWGRDDKTGKHIGWVVGWIVENNHPYFFVLNLESAEKDIDMGVRMKLLKGILKELGFLEGKM